MRFTSRLIGEKSRHTISREGFQTKHQAWHVCAQQTGRKRGWLADDVTALDAARAVVAVGEAEPSDLETGKLRDLSTERAEVVRLEAAVKQRQRELDEAEAKLAVLAAEKDRAAVELANEEFNVGPLERMEKALLALDAANQEVAKAQASLGVEFAIPLLTPELIGYWVDAKNRRCNPPVKLERAATEIVEFVDNYSGGNTGGGMFVPGDRAAWKQELCAELVAQGVARWVTQSPEGDQLVAAARRRLAQARPFNAETDGARIDMGWAVNE